MDRLPEHIEDAVEEQGWSFYYADGQVELAKHSPLGEDFVACVEVDDFERELREYCVDFDADEHAAMWVESRGENGTPESVIDLAQDALDIQEMLDELLDAVVMAQVAHRCDPREIEDLWKELGDVPFDEDEDGQLRLESRWMGFPAGTSCEEIWHWFDEAYPEGVHAFMFPAQHAADEETHRAWLRGKLDRFQTYMKDGMWDEIGGDGVCADQAWDVMSAFEEFCEKGLVTDGEGRAL